VLLQTAALAALDGCSKVDFKRCTRGLSLRTCVCRRYRWHWKRHTAHVCPVEADAVMVIAQRRACAMRIGSSCSTPTAPLCTPTTRTAHSSAPTFSSRARCCANLSVAEFPFHSLRSTEGSCWTRCNRSGLGPASSAIIAAVSGVGSVYKVTEH